MTRLPTGTIAMLIITTVRSHAQMQWTPLGPVPAIAGNSVSFDSDRDRLVAIGEPSGTVFETYEFDGVSWRLVTNTTPVLLGGYGLCYDAARHRTILFGDLGGNLTQTWDWDGIAWTMRASGGPGGRAAYRLVFHRTRGTVMMFGGDRTTGAYNELWEWNGSSWQQIVSPNPPSAANAYSTLAYDAERDKLVVHGGNVQPWNVTYEWDSSNGWQVAPLLGPSLMSRVMTYDEARRRLVLVGFNSGFGPYETWERDGTGTWTRRVDGTFPLPMTYDSLRQRVVMLGANLMAYQPVFPAAHSTFAPGCAGSLGVPSLTLTQPWTRAWLGESLGVTLANLPMSSAVLLLGFSNTTTGGLPLPADLGPFGAPGCHLRVAVDTYDVLLGSGNAASASLQVPNILALRGVRYHQQAVTPDLAQNAAGIVMSDAVTGTIGSK